MLGLFKRNKGKVTVDAPAGALAPGASVEISVKAEGLDDKAERIEAGIRCVNEYTVTHKDRDGDRSRVKTKATVHEEYREIPLGSAAQGAAVTLTLPANALPSAEGIVEWSAIARVARRRGMDVDETAPLTVVALPGPERERHEAVNLGEVTITFDVPSRVRAGEQLTGAVLVTPSEDVKVTDVKLELETLRVDVGDAEDWSGVANFDVGGVSVSLGRGGVLSLSSSKSKIEKRETLAESVIEGGELKAGQEHRFELSLAVPAGAPPTLAAPHTLLTWSLKATLARKLRDDYSAWVGFDVYNAPA